MNETFLQIVATGASGFIGGFTTWFFTRKKKRADINAVEIDNARQIITMYRDFANEMKDNAENLRKTVEEVKKSCTNNCFNHVK